MRSLLAATAVIEAIAGLSLLIAPALVVLLLVGAAFDAPAGLTVARITGTALISLGSSCWFARNDPQSRAATGLIAAMLLYNVAVVVILAHARISSGVFGIAFWPAVLLHGAMAVWCLACLRVWRFEQEEQEKGAG